MRGGSRMLVVSREKQSFHDDEFRNFPRYMRPADCLVLNDTRVYPARLHGRRNNAQGAALEIFLLRALNSEETLWRALAKPAKRARLGDRIWLGDEVEAVVELEQHFGERTVRLFAREPIAQVFEKLGEIPLPPYIRRKPRASDSERYQTVFAKQTGSAAAPTAGLHFTPETLNATREAGAEIARITLHVGLGTFAPLRSDKVSEVVLHEEWFELLEPECITMRKAGRLVCAGTTSVRALETAMLRGGLHAMTGETNLFIYPGFHFRAAGAMLTNFHLPQSSLLMLVAAFAGRELVLAAYEHAVRERYRFFSYGDCMLIE